MTKGRGGGGNSGPVSKITFSISRIEAVKKYKK